MVWLLQDYLGCNGYAIWAYYSGSGDNQLDVNVYKHLEISIDGPYIIEYSLTMYSRFYRSVEYISSRGFLRYCFILSKSNRGCSLFKGVMFI